MQNVAKIRFLINEIRPLTLAVLVFICVLDASQVSFSTVLHYFLFIPPFFLLKHEQESAKKTKKKVQCVSRRHQKMLRFAN